MKVINIQAAKTHLSRLVDQAAAGEEIVIAKAGKPLVKIIPYAVSRKPRVGGQLKGLIHETDDAWTPDTVLETEMTQTSIYPPSGDQPAQRVAEDPQ